MHTLSHYELCAHALLQTMPFWVQQAHMLLHSLEVISDISHVV